MGNMIYRAVNGVCNDENPNATYTTNDLDCDGVVTEEDCDDNNADTLNDIDCDGILNDEDDDSDGDGFISEDDCDDLNQFSTALYNDMDCNGAYDIEVLSLSNSAFNPFSCGIDENGDILCWGNDDYGQSSPPSGSFIQLSSGVYHSCAVTTNGNV